MSISHSNRYFYNISKILFHYIPAYAVDFLSLMTGNRPLLVSNHSENILINIRMYAWCMYNIIVQLHSTFLSIKVKRYHMAHAAISSLDFFFGRIVGASKVTTGERFMQKWPLKIKAFLILTFPPSTGNIISLNSAVEFENLFKKKTKKACLKLEKDFEGNTTKTWISLWKDFWSNYFSVVLFRYYMLHHTLVTLTITLFLYVIYSFFNLLCMRDSLIN